MTDFGLEDPFVGVMKGVLLSRAPGARLVDLTHGVPPQDVRTGAFHLMASVPYFPDGTLFVAVVDPGVGSGRAVLWARTGRHRFLAPDNGLLSWVERREPLLEVRSVTNPAFFLEPLSATFHGRDIFAPAAGALLAGAPARRLGPPLASWVRLPFPEPVRAGRTARGEVLALDRFGNAVTNLTPREAAGAAALRVGRRRIPIARTYADAAPGRALAVLGSAGYYELAVRDGSFARSFRVGPGARVAAAPS